METSPVGTFQELKHGEEVTIARKKFRVEILADGQTFLHGARQMTYMVCTMLNVRGEDTGLRSIRSWRTDTPVLNKALQPLRFILMGNLIQDITGKTVPSNPTQ